MSVSVTGVIRAINNLTKPLQEKALKKLGLSTKGLPGRTSDKAGITVGKDRRKIEKKIDKLKGGAVGAGGVFAAYTASDFINDLLGIKKVGDATLTKADKRRLGEAQADTPKKTKSKVKKKKPSIPTEKPTPRPKAKQFMKERSGKDSKVEFEATKGNVGMLASKKNLKPVPSGTKGKGLSMLPTKVRNNMGFMYGGGMAKKPRMSNMDYRKANKGLLVISIDMMKKKKKGKKEK